MILSPTSMSYTYPKYFTYLEESINIGWHWHATNIETFLQTISTSFFFPPGYHISINSYILETTFQLGAWLWRECLHRIHHLFFISSITIIKTTTKSLQSSLFTALKVPELPNPPLWNHHHHSQASANTHYSFFFQKTSFPETTVNPKRLTAILVTTQLETLQSTSSHQIQSLLKPSSVSMLKHPTQN